MYRSSRIDWTQPLTQTGCKLSPFGTHQDRSECLVNSNCASRWRCAKNVTTVDGLGGEHDIFGVFFPVGTAIIATDGLYATAEECLCYRCDSSGSALGCVATDDGGNGTHADATCGNTCVYGFAANVETGVCGLSLDSSATEEECQIMEFNKNPTSGPHAGKYGCFSNFACRYGTCVGIPDGGLDGPRTGEVIYDSMDACESSGQCTEGTVTVQRASVCIGDSCLYPNEFACDPLPGTWQLWRVNIGLDWRVYPRYSATVTPNAHIHWKAPVVGVYQNWPNPDGALVKRIPNRPSNDYLMFDEFGQEGFADHERVWYDSEEMYLGAKTVQGIVYPAGYEMYPNISVGFRRLDSTTVEVVLLPAAYNNLYFPTQEACDADQNCTWPHDQPRLNNDGSAAIGGRGQGWAVMHIYAPEGDCFVMPSIDFEAEFPGVIPMRLAPMMEPDSGVLQASACVFGTLENGQCVCENSGGGACEYTCGGHTNPTAPVSYDSDGMPLCE